MPNDVINELFTTNLKKMLKEKNMTYSELSNKIGVKASTVSMWMNGSNLPRMELLAEISEALGTSIAALFGVPYEENILDTNDLYKFYDSLGYIVKPIEHNKYRLLSRDIANHIKVEVTGEDLKEMKRETGKYLDFTLKRRNENTEPDKT